MKLLDELEMAALAAAGIGVRQVRQVNGDICFAPDPHDVLALCADLMGVGALREAERIVEREARAQIALEQPAGGIQVVGLGEIITRREQGDADFLRQMGNARRARNAWRARNNLGWWNGEDQDPADTLRHVLPYLEEGGETDTVNVPTGLLGALSEILYAAPLLSLTDIRRFAAFCELEPAGPAVSANYHTPALLRLQNLAAWEAEGGGTTHLAMPRAEVRALVDLILTADWPYLEQLRTLSTHSTHSTPTPGSR